MLETITKQLNKFPLTKRQPSFNKGSTSAAVLVVLHGDADDPQIVLTQRANHLNNHPGEVAFPGGMWDPIDNHLLDTALREAMEEVGLNPQLVRTIATLPVASPKRRNLMVTPFVGLVDGPLQLVADPNEIGAIFHLPVSQLLNMDHYQYFEIRNNGEALKFPYLAYKGYKVWGFTLKVLVDLVNHTLEAGIDLMYPSEKRIDELRRRGKR